MPPALLTGLAPFPLLSGQRGRGGRVAQPKRPPTVASFSWSARHFVRGMLHVVFSPPGSAGPERGPDAAGLTHSTQGLPSSSGRAANSLRRQPPPTASYAVEAPAILNAGRFIRSSLLLEPRAPGLEPKRPRSRSQPSEGWPTMGAF
ncbi:hypothetical protein NDU88_003010 [Pleurodeles waltl]|uniref:Uncharacterized protein n=1 Tax=Pleurodeles waltl TaxID=8319 RepID=A0AAV7QEI7_PLEWA|nr:hypothetical protein NDU88_003010 [Pleurodeles waltl]